MQQTSMEFSYSVGSKNHKILLCRSISRGGTVLVVSDNHFARSTSRADEKSDNTMGEERGGNRFFTLFGARIPVPESVEAPVPHVVDELATLGNIRNGHAADNEKMKQRVTNVVSETQPGQTSSAQDKLLSTLTEAGPHDPIEADEVDHNARGVKRKANEALSAPWEVQMAADRTKRTARYRLTDLIRKWNIDAEKVEHRTEEFLKRGLPKELSNFPRRVESMAIGSLYFERGPLGLKGDGKGNLEGLTRQLRKEKDLIKELGLENDKVDARAVLMYENEYWQPSRAEVVDMAIGMELYVSLHPSG